MVRKGFLQVRDAGVLNLFKSYKSGYGEGEQERDFLYVRDAVAMTLFFLEHEDVGGIYNVGSGRARNWNDLASAVFKAMDKKVDITRRDIINSLPTQIRKVIGHIEFAKPLDKDLLQTIFQKFDKIITVEDGCLQGGFSSAILEFTGDNNLKAKIIRLGIPDEFINHGTQEELRKECG